MLVGPIVMRMRRQSWLRQDSFTISLLGGFDQKYHSNCPVFSSIQPLHSSIQKQGKEMKAILELLSCVSCPQCFFSLQIWIPHLVLSGNSRLGRSKSYWPGLCWNHLHVLGMSMYHKHTGIDWSTSIINTLCNSQGPASLLAGASKVDFRGTQKELSSSSNPTCC